MAEHSVCIREIGVRFPVGPHSRKQHVKRYNIMLTRNIFRDKTFWILGFFYLLFFVGDDIFGTRNFFGILEFLPKIITRPVIYALILPVQFLWAAIYFPLIAPLLCPKNSSSFLSSEYFMRSCDDFTLPGIAVIIFIHIVEYLTLYVAIYRSIQFIKLRRTGRRD